MALTLQLTPQLKRLRLSGVLESLELRNQQAIQDKLSYVEFLARLIQDEVERRAQKQLQLRLRRAAFHSDKTLEGFDFSFNPTINRQQVLDLAVLPPMSVALAAPQFARSADELLPGLRGVSWN